MDVGDKMYTHTPHTERKSFYYGISHSPIYVMLKHPKSRGMIMTFSKLKSVL